MTSAVIYARLSDVRKGDTEGIERQIREAEAVADRLGVTIVERLVDNDLSAADRKKKRPAFERLMIGMAHDEWDVVILRSLERWVRMPSELENIIEVAEKSTVRVESVHGGQINLQTRQGRMLARMMTNIAIDEVDGVRERVLDWHADRARQGLPLSGAAGFGFNADKLTVNEDEASLIREAAERVLAGDALAAIVRRWTERGVTFRGRPWRPSALRRILLAPRTAGLRIHQGTIVGKAAWPSILDRETFERVAKILNSPTRNTATDRRQKLLTGLVLCGKCGAALNHKWDQKGPRYYCRHCLGTLIASNHLETLVFEMLLVAVDEPELRQAVKAQQEQAGVADAVDLIASLESDLTDLAAELGEGRLTMAEWKLARAGIEKRLADARVHLSRQRTESALDAWVGNAAALRDAWDGLTHGAKRTIITAVFESITIAPANRGLNRFDPERVKVVWRY